MAVSAAERRFLLGQVNVLAATELGNLWAQASRLSDVDFAAYVTAGYPALAEPFVDVAASLAATWFELSDPASAYQAVTAPRPPVAQLESSARWALGANGDAAVARLEGSLQRTVFNGARDTTLLNVERTDSKWARVALPTACAFCRLLATREDAYRSRETAARDVHDHCSCQPLEVRGDQDWTRLVDNEYLDTVTRWGDEYEKARAEAGTGSPQQILSAWRQIDGAYAK